MDLRHQKIYNLQQQQKQLKNKLLGKNSACPNASGNLRQRKMKQLKEDSYNLKKKQLKLKKVKRASIKTKGKKLKKKNNIPIKYNPFY